MTKDEFVEVLLCLGGGASYKDVDMFDEVRRDLDAGTYDWCGCGGLYFIDTAWFRPLEYVSRLMNNEVEYPDWVGEAGDK